MTNDDSEACCRCGQSLAATDTALDWKGGPVHNQTGACIEALLSANARLRAEKAGAHEAITWLEKDRDLWHDRATKYHGQVLHLMPALAAANERLTAELAEAQQHLRFVERWANHHAAKPMVTAKEALGVIQHYDPIKAITHSYVDGVVPDTFDPYAALAEAREDAEQLRSAVVGAYGWLWCVNQEPGTPNQFPAEKAAYKARALLRELLTHEQRGVGINNAVMQRDAAIDAARGER